MELKGTKKHICRILVVILCVWSFAIPVQAANYPSIELSGFGATHSFVSVYLEAGTTYVLTYTTSSNISDKSHVVTLDGKNGLDYHEQLYYGSSTTVYCGFTVPETATYILTFKNMKASDLIINNPGINPY